MKVTQMLAAAAAMAATLSAALPARATTAIAMRLHDRVMLAADSRQVSLADKSIARNICKIGHANGVFWVATGINRNKALGYSIDALASKAFSGPGSFDEHISLFKRLAGPGISYNLALLRTLSPNDPRVPRPLPFYPAPAVQVAFGTLDQGTPILKAVEFVGVVQPGSPSVTLLVRETDPNLGQRVKMGLHEEIDAAVQADPSLSTFSDEHGAVAATIRLIKIEEAAHPDVVGGPVAVVVIGPSGVSWPSRGKCASR